MHSLQAILENIMVFDALHKRKLFLDTFGEGLEVYGVLSFVQKFPAEMKPVFVSRGILSPEDVLKILSPNPTVDNMIDKERRVYRFFQNYVKQCTDKRT